jgi:predicted transcriptional regulator
MPRGARPSEGPEIRLGSRMAKLFRQARQLTNTRACNLEAILDEDEIDLAESDAEDPGYTASLIRFDSDKGGGIMLARGQSQGRRRFSIAHELAHFHLPTHRAAHVQSRCNERDLRARRHDVERHEWEANDFAAELLMPHRLFAEDARVLSISIDCVDQLAAPGMYDVSRLAAAWRLVQVTREAAALVVSTKGVVEWLVRSDSFSGWLTERRQGLSPETLAAAAFRGEGVTSLPVEVPTTAWFDNPTHATGMLLESTYAIEQLGQVVSLLWQPPDWNGDED